jgi:hypothetical protein
MPDQKNSKPSDYVVGYRRPTEGDAIYSRYKRQSEGASERQSDSRGGASGYHSTKGRRRGAHSLQGKKALKPSRLRPRDSSRILRSFGTSPSQGSPVFQTPFQHAAVLRSDSNYHARLSTAD